MSQDLREPLGLRQQLLDLQVLKGMLLPLRDRRVLQAQPLLLLDLQVRLDRLVLQDQQGQPQLLQVLLVPLERTASSVLTGLQDLLVRRVQQVLTGLQDPQDPQVPQVQPLQ